MTTVALHRRPPRPRQALRPDPAQDRVVAHRGGPLLVLAGPGTGKTTTLVEAVAARVDAGGAPDRLLVLTFSRRAALELRERIGLRLGLTRSAPAAWTFHAFCFALLRAQRDPADPSGPLRLLTGPQQQAAVRELLAGDVADGAAGWPDALRACLRTRGLAEELRSLLSRTRSLGLDPGGLAQVAAAEQRPDWAAAARFFEQYLQVLDLQGLLDYGELVHRAAVLAADPEVRTRLRAQYDAVFVDEYQDTDPAQERLLASLAGDGRDLTVVGDPDQAIYAFRGADVHGLLAFPQRFRTAAGAPAPVETLRVCRRFGPGLLEPSRRVARLLPAAGLAADTVRAHRELVATGEGPDGRLRVELHATAAGEAAAVADLLRRAHLHAGVPWERMAVLVRSAVRSLPLLRRSLGLAGVPVASAGDELPLAAEPAVAPLLLALRVAADPSRLDVEATRLLLVSPLVGADSADLRRLGRALRAVQRRQAVAAGAPALASPTGELLRQAVREPEWLLFVPDRLGAPVQRLVGLLSAAGDALRRGDGVEAALWQLWTSGRWRRTLEDASLAGGPAGQAADRDLDAVLALFELARRHAELRPGSGVDGLVEELASQEIPADTLAERAGRSGAVRLLTAHRSKGLEWDLVVVCGVQEGVWPDVRRRGSLLEPDRLGADGLTLPPDRASLLADERRLFYVALTRARTEVVVTAVASTEEDGDRPSRFLEELGVTLPPVTSRPPELLTLAGLVGRLRRAAVDPARSPAMRAAAARRLAVLAAANTPDGSRLVPAADPSSWWGTRPQSRAPDPPYPPTAPVRLSGTSLEGLRRCPLQWLLRHEIHADTTTSPALGIGRLLHQLAEDVAAGQRPADVEELMAAVDTVWSAIPFEAEWVAAQQRDSVREGLVRFLDWCARPDARTLAGAEVPFDLELTLPAGRVALRGRADRVELDTDGRVWVVDLKTGRSAPSGADVEEHLQLGVYQLAVLRGGLAGPSGPLPTASGGAELLQLRIDAAGLPKVQVQPRLEPAEDGAPTWVEQELDGAVARLHAEDFPATPGEHCSTCTFRVTCPAQPEGRQVLG